MIVTTGAGRHSPNSDLNERESFILHERARRHHWEGTGLLSIKTFFRGRALYDIGPGRHAVEPGSYLLLNHARPYTITIDATKPVESFCIFFGRGLAADVQRSLAASADALLDEPEGSHEVELFERTYPHDTILSPLLLHLRDTVADHTDEPGWLDEQLHAVMERLLAVHRMARAETARLTAGRASTREELYRRLHRARDFAAACFDEPVTLERMAQVACLSPNHLLRTFRQLFGETPHQYLTGRRLDRARHLLAESDRPVTDICFAVGFESLGSFSRLFRRHIGMSPIEYRRRIGDFGEAAEPASAVS